MIADPARRGGALAAWWARIEPSLWSDLEDSGLLPAGADARARGEWQCLSLVAAVRGLVAAGGFNRETVAALDRFHACVAEAWDAEPEGEPADVRRERAALRHDEYAMLGQAAEASGAEGVPLALGEACAAHLAAGAAPHSLLAEQLAALYEALVEGATLAVREASDPSDPPEPAPRGVPR